MLLVSGNGEVILVRTSMGELGRGGVGLGEVSLSGQMSIKSSELTVQ